MNNVGAMPSERIDWVGTTDLHYILQTTAGMPLLKSNAARTTRILFLTVLWCAYNSSELRYATDRVAWIS